MITRNFTADLHVDPIITDLEALTVFLHAPLTDTGDKEQIHVGGGKYEEGKNNLFDGADCETVEYSKYTTNDGVVRLSLEVGWKDDPTPQLLAQVVRAIKVKIDRAAVVTDYPPELADPNKPIEPVTGKSAR
jgi:hypothetical protein